MKLSVWMKGSGRSPAKLAEEVRRRGQKCTPGLVRQVVNGKKRFGLDTIHIIQKMSRGKVTFNDLYAPMEENGRVASGI